MTMSKERLTEARHNDYRNARAAMKRIDDRAAKNLYDWFIVGQAMIDAREEVFETLLTNRSDTKAYRVEFGAVLRREKLHEDNGGPDKTTRSFLMKIMARWAEVSAWHSSLPQQERREWNHPSSVWRHFEKAHTPPKPLKDPKASPLTGLTPEEEAKHVESAQIEALQKRDAKISELRDTNREHHVTIAGLHAEIARLRAVIGELLRRLGVTVSELPTDAEILEATTSGQSGGARLGR